MMLKEGVWGEINNSLKLLEVHKTSTQKQKRSATHTP